ncbi:uncharacterized protein LOC128200610 [Galleria mellonella]|uniref:Uncharacterized protein LOC128200610 n=1 Tax=Galleria mellonella TaxID=7137 RepID=A0ABM3MGK6_GALME|nr:uncharacterized protein LOC128200610 [Galleria mellonella]XP_052750546.1 uncharacterized protein LOC128200610 [Galleria mellonella]XP_052750547.1 uncharacterized protein LOC128200610 [Galleria mellonella]
MEGTITPESRHHSQAALGNITARMDRLRVAISQSIMLIRERSSALPSSYLRSTSLPDKIIMQQKDHECLATSRSPDIELKTNSTNYSIVRTPQKNSSCLSPPKLEVNSHVRKRLLFGDSERILLTPEKIDFSDISTLQKFEISSPIKSTPPIKKTRLEKTIDNNGPFDVALKGLSPNQLIDIITSVTYKHPEIEYEIRKDMPVPDLSPFKQRLLYLKSNIYKGLRTLRSASKTDLLAYSRTSTHLAAFKKCLVEQGKVLVESQHWESVIKYVLLAWKYVRATPVWDHQAHNACRKQCFEALIAFCIMALKKGHLEKDVLIYTKDKLQDMVADSEDILSCIKIIKEKLSDL